MGLAGKSLENSGKDLTEYSIFRDEFDSLGSIYKDVFEITHTALRIQIAMLNLSNRGNYTICYDQQTRKLKDLKNLRAFDVESLIKESHEIDKLLYRFDRNIRNSVGHTDIYYDVSTGFVTLKGKRYTTLFEFAGSLINASILLAYAISFVYIVSNMKEDILGFSMQKLLDGLPELQYEISEKLLQEDENTCMICGNTQSKQILLNGRPAQVCEDCIEIQQEMWGSKVEFL